MTCFNNTSQFQCLYSVFQPKRASRGQQSLRTGRFGGNFATRSARRACMASASSSVRKGTTLSLPPRLGAEFGTNSAVTSRRLQGAHSRLRRNLLGKRSVSFKIVKIDKMLIILRPSKFSKLSTQFRQRFVILPRLIYALLCNIHQN